LDFRSPVTARISTNRRALQAASAAGAWTAPSTSSIRDRGREDATTESHERDGEDVVAHAKAGRLLGASLDGVDLRGADLRGVDLRRTFWRDARMEGAKLDGSLLSGAVLAGAALEARASLGRISRTPI